MDEGLEGVLLADGFEGALLGVVQRCGQQDFAVYDAAKCIAILQERDGMDEEEAIEFFHFNVAGAWCGDGTPGFLYPMPEPE